MRVHEGMPEHQHLLLRAMLKTYEAETLMSATTSLLPPESRHLVLDSLGLLDRALVDLRLAAVTMPPPRAPDDVPRDTDTDDLP